MPDTRRNHEQQAELKLKSRIDQIKRRVPNRLDKELNRILPRYNSRRITMGVR